MKEDVLPDPPNIIYILSDDQGWTDYSFMGHEYIETPNIDRLAGKAVYCRMQIRNIII